jgi:branched-chain amino acid aminotransferase
MYYNNDTVLFLDGKWIRAAEAKTDLFSQTLHYGSGVFEGLRSYATASGPRIFKPKAHYKRLIYSAETMHIKIKYTPEELASISYELLAKNGLTNAYIRPLVYLGSNMALTPTNESHVMITAFEWGRYLGNNLLNVMISSYQRPNPKSCHVDAKVVGHYTNSILATTEAKKAGYDEALLLDANGFVAEGPGANFFFEKKGVLYTPPEGNILPGITRRVIIKMAQEMGYPVKEKLFTPEEVYEADSAFFTGTAAEVAGIKSINDKPFKMEWEETMGYTLFLMYKNRVHRRDIQDFSLA